MQQCPNRVAVGLAEGAGIDVNQILDLLVRNAAVERAAFCSDLSIRLAAGGPTGVKATLEVLVGAEQCAVRGSPQVCDMTPGRDHPTADLSIGEPPAYLRARS